MKFKTLIPGGGYSADVSMPGGAIQGEVILGVMPEQPMQAAPKRYADEQTNLLKVTNVTTGKAPYGAVQLSINSRSVDVQVDSGGVMTTQYQFASPGVYPRVAVDTKGRVTAGLALVAVDIPGFSWNKVTSGKPTTAAGYGLTDALEISGGSLTAQITLAADPSSAQHAATKRYSDAGAALYAIAWKAGDTLLKPVDKAYAGWLRCNGADVSKTTYPALYAKVGDAFNQAGTPAGHFRLPTLSVTSTLFVYIRT